MYFITKKYSQKKVKLKKLNCQFMYFYQWCIEVKKRIILIPVFCGTLNIYLHIGWKSNCTESTRVRFLMNSCWLDDLIWDFVQLIFALHKFICVVSGMSEGDNSDTVQKRLNYLSELFNIQTSIKIYLRSIDRRLFLVLRSWTCRYVRWTTV